MRILAYFDRRPTNRLRKSCGSAKPYRQEQLRARALHNENARGGPMMVDAAGVL